MAFRLLRLSWIAALAVASGAALPAVSIVDPHAIYPEGPIFRDGRLLYVEYAGPGVKTWDGKHVGVFWQGEHCGPSGLIAYRDNHLLIACYDANALVEVDEHGNTLRTIDKDSSGKPFIGPNDFAPDGSGGVYFSASGVYDLNAPITGAVLHMSADGRRVVELANTIHYSNGLTLSKDGKYLLVAEDLAGRILSFPINADGTLGARTVWARLRDLAAPTRHEDAYNGPDGLKLGPDGNYYIAQNGSGRVLVVSDAKKLVRIVRVPTRYVTNVNFGADGARTLYITGVFEQFKAPYPGAVYRWTP
jgi:sugar lactone lactonase YvrE